MSHLTLESQIPLSITEYNSALKIIDKTNFSVRNREEYCKVNNLDLKIHMPDAQWSRTRGAPGYKFLDKLLDKKYETLNNLRLYCFPFSGYCRYADVYNTIHEKFAFNIIDDYKPDNDIFKITEGDNICLDECSAIMDTYPIFLDYFHPYPIKFGEFGQFYKDKLINLDTKCTLERLAYMQEGKIFDHLKNIKDRQPVILEVGAGYGSLAYQMMKNIPNAKYIIIDIPESLLVSSIYLSTVLPDADINFINNYEIDRLNLLQNKSVDLIINTISMSEFLPEQVEFYCQKLYPLLSDNGMFFEHNEDRSLAGFCNCASIIRHYFKLKSCLSGIFIPYKQRNNCWLNIWGK